MHNSDKEGFRFHTPLCPSFSTSSVGLLAAPAFDNFQTGLWRLELVRKPSLGDYDRRREVIFRGIAASFRALFLAHGEEGSERFMQESQKIKTFVEKETFQRGRVKFQVSILNNNFSSIRNEYTIWAIFDQSVGFVRWGMRRLQSTWINYFTIY